MFFQSIFTELFDDELFLLIRVARIWFSSAFTSIVFDQSIMNGKYDFQNGLPVGILPAARVSKTFTSYFQWLRTIWIEHVLLHPFMIRSELLPKVQEFFSAISIFLNVPQHFWKKKLPFQK